MFASAKTILIFIHASCYFLEDSVAKAYDSICLQVNGRG